MEISETEILWEDCRPTAQLYNCKASSLMPCNHFTFLHHYTTSHFTTAKSHTHPFNGPLSRTTRVRQYQKGKTNLDFTEARDSEWQWHQLPYASLHLAPDR